MDNEQIEKWLYDIKLSIEEIDSYFEGEGGKDFFLFTQSPMRKRAIERNLEIIGEAMNRILVKAPGIPIRNARKIVNLRNHVIHSYDSISDENIWAIVINNLPELKKDINNLIL